MKIFGSFGGGKTQQMMAQAQALADEGHPVRIMSEGATYMLNPRVEAVDNALAGIEFLEGML